MMNITFQEECSIVVVPSAACVNLSMDSYVLQGTAKCSKVAPNSDCTFGFSSPTLR